MPVTQEFVFTGVDAVSAPHAIREGDVQAATNIDFGFTPGAAQVRRGCSTFRSVGTNAIKTITRHYSNAWNIDNSPYYIVDNQTVVTRFIGTNSTVVASASGEYIPGIGAYKDHAYIALATVHVKDNGTNVTEWVKQAPGAAPTVSIGTGTLFEIAGTFTAAEGTVTATSTVGGYVVTTATTDPVSNRLQLEGTPTSTNLAVRGTATIDDYGTDYLTISFSNPSVVTRVSRDYSIGSTDFANYWHSEIDTTVTDVAISDPEKLIEGLNIDIATRDRLLDTVRTITRIPQVRINWASDAPNQWLVPRPLFQFVGSTNTPAGWTNIQKVRIIVEATLPVEVTVTRWVLDGDEDYPLNDPDVGVTYFETWATLDANGNILGESAPGPPSATTKVQHGAGIVTSTSTATGTSHGITHRIFYRHGGYLPDAYAVATVTYATQTATDRKNDLDALTTNIALRRNIWAHSEWPGHVTSVSEPYYSRLFLGYGNKLAWTMPNAPDVIPKTSYTQVSHEGDAIQALLVWDRLIIINRDSVYEMAGDVFEGTAANWVLQRSGAHRGSIAVRSIVKTPHGIPLLNYDGLTFYLPGRGVDVSVDWIDAQMSDVYKGAESYSPSALKGNRMPVAYRPYLFNSCAAYADDKLFLGLPTGTNTYPSTVFVCDFRQQKVWPYVYPFTFTSMFWDSVDNRLLLGTTDGKVMLAEVGLLDTGTNGTATGIPWSIKTRAWTAPSDTRLENIMVEYEGSPGMVVNAYYDSGTATAIGTLTGTVKDWQLFPMSATIANNVVFEITGTQGLGNSSTVYGLKFDALTEPPRVNFYRTEHAVKDTEHLWDVAYADVEVVGTATGTAFAGTLTGVVFVDNTAVATHSFAAPTNGRVRVPITLPAETYGYVAYTTYTGVPFKHWTTLYDARPEPPRVNSYQTDPFGNGEESIVEGCDWEINPNGTVTSVAYVDNTAVATFTSTGTKRRIFNGSCPADTYGRLCHVVHTGTGFKHYRSWFHLRPEPDLHTSWVSEREVPSSEAWWKSVGMDFDCRGHSVTAKVYIDNTAVMTKTLTGSGRDAYGYAYPAETYGGVGYVLYTSTGRFKPYRTWYDREEEPDQLLFYATPVVALPSDNYVKTWSPEINPLGGTCTGVLYVDGTAVSTQSMTGTLRKRYEFGLPNVTVGKTIQARYSSTTNFKHYRNEDEFEFEPKPFNKTTWLVTYKKVGGATQLDMARFYSLEAEGTGTYTLTAVWDLDGTAFTTNTLTMTGREYRDRVAFPPGARGYIFQQRVSSTTPFRVWKSNLDIEQIGVKGLSRRTFVGTPDA
jgi:hypothetical protein